MQQIIAGVAEFVWAASPTPTPTPVDEVKLSVSLDAFTWLGLLVGPAVTAAIIGLVSLWPASGLRRKETVAAAGREFQTRALNEFYSPICEMLDEVRILRDALKSRMNGGEDWHLLDNVEDIRQNPGSWSLFDSIVKTNRRIRKILDEKSGLALDDVTESGRWRVHQTMLEGAFGDPEYVADAKLSYFPKEFEAQLRTGRQKLTAQLRPEEKKK
ncbi:hypothetical protein ACIQTT_10440 [Microbacterium sp. NPDC090225]|uniref:hypothetical protein n=1 Tax=Microbacterium sp. NPDC090225 TaxID=3364207 RepID=UPI00381D827E